LERRGCREQPRRLRVQEQWLAFIVTTHKQEARPEFLVRCFGGRGGFGVRLDAAAAESIIGSDLQYDCDRGLSGAFAADRQSFYPLPFRSDLLRLLRAGNAHPWFP
jgi:hypothetical protein